MNYDYIIVGVGLVGCVLVNCLLVDLNNKVLLLEVGSKDSKLEISILLVFV